MSVKIIVDSTVDLNEKVKARMSAVVPLSVRFGDAEYKDGETITKGGVCNIGYDAERNSFWKVPCNYIPVKYPGTGDIFTSVLVGALTAGANLPAAMDQATGFVEMAVKTTFAEGREARQGAMVEKCLPWLVSGDTRNKFEIL